MTGKTWALFLLIIVFLSTSVSRICRGDVQNLTDKTRTEEMFTIRQVLERFSDSHKICFVVEGDGTKLLKKISIDLNLVSSMNELEVLLNKISDEGDYESVRNNGCILLLSRYTNDLEIPSISLAEAEEVADDVYKIFTSSKPSVLSREDEQILINQVARSFTHEQMRLLDNGLPVRNLSALQKDSLYKCAYSEVYRSYSRGIQGGRKVLSEASMQSIVFKFKKDDEFGVVLFGIDRLDTDSGKVRFFPLSHPQWARTAFNLVIYTGRPPNNNMPDVTAPDEQSALSNNKAQDIDSIVSSHTNLRDLCALLSMKGNRPVKIDQPLESKPLVVLGDRFTSSDTLLRGAAAVYGLRVVQTDETTTVLRRWNWRSAYEAKDLRKSLLRVFPSSLLRLGAMRQSDKPVLTESTSSRMRQSSAFASDQINRMRVIAITRIRRDVDPRIQEAKNHTVPLSEVSNSAKDNLGLVLLADCLPAIMAVTNENQHACISDFNSSSLFISGMNASALVMKPDTQPKGATEQIVFTGVELPAQ